MCRMLQKTPEMHEWLSGHRLLPFLFVLFLIIQYFLSREGISVTFDNFISNIKNNKKNNNNKKQKTFLPP